jgi:hypothetical protein
VSALNSQLKVKQNPPEVSSEEEDEEEEEEVGADRVRRPDV